jgi:hypothetical protein
MKHRNGTGRALQLFVVLAEAAQCLPGTVHQRRVGYALMLPNQGAQFRRQGECDQEVIARNQPLCLLLYPALALVVLAVRTTAVTAGMGHKALHVAVATPRQHLLCHVAATHSHSVQSL